MEAFAVDAAANDRSGGELSLMSLDRGGRATFPEMCVDLKGHSLTFPEMSDFIIRTLYHIYVHFGKGSF